MLDVPPYDLSATAGVYAGAPTPFGIYGLRLSYRIIDWLIVRGAYEGGAALAIVPSEADSTDPAVPTALTLNRLHASVVTSGPLYLGAGWTVSQVAYQLSNVPPHAAIPQGAPIRLDARQYPEAILGCRWPFGSRFLAQAEARLALNGEHTFSFAFGERF